MPTTKTPKVISTPDNTILLIGPIDEVLTASVFVNFMEADAVKQKNGIVVRIFSAGGQGTAAFAIYDLLRMARNRVVTEAYGDASSAAALIFQAGSWRRIAPNARMLLHNGSVDVEHGNFNGHEFKASADLMKDLDRQYRLAFRKRSGISEKQMAKYCDEERVFKADEAVAAGLADEVMP